MKSAKEKEEGFFPSWFELFRSLKLTIFLLILLAILSVVGTVITPERGPRGLHSTIWGWPL